ncbi:MAG: preprotein translocase subunit SecE [bacterium]|nr:preprotein translocase subunit SecE [bacterium]
MVKKIKTYLAGVVEELKKVSFPSKEDTKQMTILVIALSTIMALYVAGVDFGFSSFTKWLISK